MISLEELFSDGQLKEFLEKKNDDPWEDTNFAKYVYLSSSCKGSFGELLVEKYMRKKGSVVLPRNNKGHDRVIDGFKTEIKFSLCVRSRKGLKKDNFVINHISKSKDWEKLIFFGINKNYNESKMIWFDKEDFINNIDCFKKQQGGKDANNDDYMYGGDVNHLLMFPFVKNIDSWTAKIGPLEYFYA